MILVATMVALVLGAAAPAGTHPSTPAARAHAKRCHVAARGHRHRRHRQRLQRRACRRAQRKPAKRHPAPAPPAPVKPTAPAPPTAPLPGAAAPPGDPATPPPSTTPTDPPPTDPPPPPAEPYFLTLYARDAGNGDFRLTPALGAIPSGRLVLSYKNLDLTAHDLWLRPVAPAGADQQLFAPSSSSELRRTELHLTPGRYLFLCRMPGHDAMRQPFEVTAPATP